MISFVKCNLSVVLLVTVNCASSLTKKIIFSGRGRGVGGSWWALSVVLSLLWCQSLAWESSSQFYWKLCSKVLLQQLPCKSLESKLKGFPLLPWQTIQHYMMNIMLLDWRQGLVSPGHASLHRSPWSEALLLSAALGVGVSVGVYRVCR